MTVETQDWRPDAARPGYLRLERVRTIGEVFADLRDAVGELGPGHDEYFAVMVNVDAEREWPDGRIAVFAVNGSSEGDYIHVEVHAHGRRDLLILAKTFDGRDAAWTFARRLADLLEA